MIYHKSVLLNESINLLITEKSGFYVDATGGGGGHSKEILKRITPDAKLIIFDRDQDALDNAKKELHNFEDYVIFINDNFANIKDDLNRMNIHSISGIIFDLGLSSFQIDNANRGFSFTNNGPLDMRADKSQNFSAKDIINNYSFEKLFKIIKEFGEEPFAKRIAKRILAKRPVDSTVELAKIIKDAAPSHKINPIVRTFQAIRIAVNNELENLEKALIDSIQLLSSGCRIVVLSYHSLEDRIVKNTFKREDSSCICDKKILKCLCGHMKQIEIITKKPLIPAEQEIFINPRSRSCKLRAAQKI